MCKNLIYGLLAAGMLLATSCIYEDIDTLPAGDDAQVSFSLDFESLIQTRASHISDGTKADKLVYAIYKVDQTTGASVLLNIAGSTNGQVVLDNFTSGTDVTVSLAKGQRYRAAFWAQNKDCDAYDTQDLTNVKVSYGNATNNDELRDAFWATLEFVAESDAAYHVELKRPFAQINVGVIESDWNAAVASGFLVAESSSVIKNAATSMNLLTGAVGDEADVVVNMLPSAIPNESLYVNTDLSTDDPERYIWLSTCYILVPDHTNPNQPGLLGGASATLESAEFTFIPNDGGVNIVMSEGLTNIPVQRNWRTNILGRVLTGDTNFNITIDPSYNNDYIFEYPAPYITIAEQVKYNSKIEDFHIEGSTGLAWVASNLASYGGFEGKTLTLTKDVDLAGVKTIGDSFAPIGSTGERDDRNRLICEPFKGTFDGNGKTISNIAQSGWDMGYEWGQYGSIGLFAELQGATVKNVVLEGFDCQVEGGDIAFIAGSATGDCTFENIEIKSGSIGTYNNGIGGIIGWSGAGNYTFKDIKLGSDVVIGGLWGSFDSSVGGIVGQAEVGATYNFENVEINCRLDVYNDVTASYQYYQYRMSGMIIGRCDATIQIDGRNYPDMSKYNINCTNVTVNFGDWMNYHYCMGFSGSRYTRVEPGYSYGGLDVTAEDHAATCTDHMLCLPFTALFGGDQYGVSPITAYDGVTVNYPDSYNPGI